MNKKIASCLLSLLFLSSCGGGGSAGGGGAAPATGGGGGSAAAPSGPAAENADTRTIRIGSWWDFYFTSKDKDIHADPKVNDEIRAQAMLDNLRRVEEKYNARIKDVNLTWEGSIESINTSIMAGQPDCDMYYVDLQFGVPAVLNGYALALEDFLDPSSDILNGQVGMKHLNLMDSPKNYLFSEVEKDAVGYPLGFNLDMIEDANLEDPRDLYERGEWTWDKWREYMQKLTKDTNGDGVVDVYGYGGYWVNLLQEMLLSNNAHIAGDKKEGISSPATLEVLSFINDMYNTDKSARPWDETLWENNLTPFVDGAMAFFTTKDWIISEMTHNGDDLSFELGVVPYPYGPSGTKASSQKTAVGGNWLMIPIGVKDPKFVYEVYEAYRNWYDGDLEIRDEGGTADWQRDMYLSDRNFDMALENGKVSAFDMWNAMGIAEELTLVNIMNGTETPAQYSEKNRQIVQDRINSYFGVGN
ncbi:hypothetical protein FACS1894188_00400 [Clostridia bacterium]|nr:hypothetical protein FACS1894188_00400 [Clostridia bacterium]